MFSCLTEKTKKKAEQVTTRISRPTNRTRSNSVLKSRIASSGFTLLEVIITVTIIAAIVALSLPRLSNRNNEIRAVVRKLAVISRDLKARAKLNNATYRLAISMSEEGAREPKHEFWVEKAHGQVLNNYDPEDPPKLQVDEEKDDDAPKSPFTPDTRVMKKPEVLPKDLLFESIELGSLEEPVSSGIVYIHYLPTGFADEAVIHLKSGERLRWTLAVEPLTGRVDIIDKFVALKDLRER